MLWILLLAVVLRAPPAHLLAQEQEEEPIEAETDQETEASEPPPGPPPPPDGILPVSEIARLSYPPGDRPLVAFHDGRLFVATRSGSLEVHDAATGAFSWKLGLPGESLFAPVLLHAEPLRILLATRAGNLLVIEGETGQILKELSLGYELALPPLVAGSTVFLAASGGDVVFFDLESGTERFRTATGEEALALSLGSGLLVVSGAERTLSAVEAASGRIRWIHRGRAGFHAPAAFDATGERLYVGDDAGEFHCLDASDGKSRFHWSTGAAIRGRPLVDGRRVYVANFGNNVYAYDSGGGSEQWRTGVPGRPAMGPVRVGRRLVLATLDGVLIEIDPERGALGKSFAAPGELASAPDFFVAEPTASLASPFAADDGATKAEPPWFSQHRIALPLRTGEVLLLGHVPPPREEPEESPTGQDVQKKGTTEPGSR